MVNLLERFKIMSVKRSVVILMVFVLVYSVIEILRKSAKFEGEFELYRFYLNVAVIIAVIVIYLLVKRIASERFKIPNQNKIKRFTLFDKIAFIVFSVGVSDLLEEVAYIYTIGNNGGIPKNQKNNNNSLEDNPLWYSMFDSSITAPVIEEIMFRGIFYLLIFSLFQVWNSGRKRLLVYIIFLLFSSIYFGVRHVSVEGDYEYIYPYIASGIVFTVVFIITKNIMYSAIVHGIGNLFSTLKNAEQLGVSSISHGIGGIIAIVLWIYLIVYIVVQVIRKRKWIYKTYRELNK